MAKDNLTELIQLAQENADLKKQLAELTKEEEPETQGKGKVFAFIGPSGSGKSTLAKELLKNHPETTTNSVSYTTREPREGEVWGADYYFISGEDFETMVSCGAFLETTEIHGNRYGTSSEYISTALEAAYDVICEVDVAGARALQEAFTTNRVVVISIEPPSLEPLEGRLKLREGTTEEDTTRRLEDARQQLEDASTLIPRYILDHEQLEDNHHMVETIYMSNSNFVEEDDLWDGVGR